MNFSYPVYLDYNATCPVDDRVCEAVSFAMQELWANPSSSNERGKKAKFAISKARESVAKMINADSAEDIIFMSGGTEANNSVIYSVVEEWFHQKANCHGVDSLPHIVTTNIEHDSISKLLAHLELNSRCCVTRVPVNTEKGYVSPDNILEAIRPNTCLVSVMLANNETGVLQPVSEIGQCLRKVQGVRFHTDAAQVIGKLPVDVQKLQVDFLTVVGHKFYGPRIGALYVRNLGKGREHFYPLFFGGGQERNFRPGTENTPMIVGLGKAADLVNGNLSDLGKRLLQLRYYFEERLQDTFGCNIQINFEKSDRLPNTISVAFKNIPFTGTKLLSLCTGVIASTGAACHSGTTKPSAILLACGISEELASRTVRFSLGKETTESQIDLVISELVTIFQKLVSPHNGHVE